MPAKKTDPLNDYRAKRSADSTPEPFGQTRARGGRLFVVQHHAARQLHYDFRLEMDGVLRSWAIPKGPSANPADKRLAVQVEDHPLEYASFEGHIPEGNYGAGAVIVWDRGMWVPIGDPREGLAKGKLLFELKGYKLRGKWTLIKTKRGPKDWLFIKEKDGYVSNEDGQAFPRDSILSGLNALELKEGRGPAKSIAEELERVGATKKKLTAKKTKVMLAQSGSPFSKVGWVFEIKYDGYRLLIERTGDATALYSRAGNDLTPTFPEIVDVIDALPFDHLIMDGEAVVHDEKGLPSFSRLQRRGRLTQRLDIQRATVELPATLYAFDLLAFGDYDLRPLPLQTRKAILKQLLPSIGPVRYSDHIEQHGETLYQQVRELGLEGMVGKRLDSRYRSGRSSDWVKITVEKSDDFAVVGFTTPKRSQPGFGALLLGQCLDGRVTYAGRAGTGFTAKNLREIGALLQQADPVAPPLNAPQENGMNWVEPRLVCEVRFKHVTPDGVLRQPVFIRLRDDKQPKDCIRQTPERELSEPVAIQPRASVPNKTIQFTNQNKVFWPEEGYTKGDLIDYYRMIAPWLLPYLDDRPVVLTRYPDGIDGKSFFQKDAPKFAPEWIRIETMWSENAQREINYFIIEDTEALLYIINLGTIPLHIWSSRMQTLERPDWCILDLDPKGAPFAHVRKIAKGLRSLCDEIRLPCYVKTSGSTGLHVLIPLGSQYTYQQSRTLGELLARVIVTKLPDIATITRSVSSREGRVYIDYLQNGHGRLLVSPFSVRPLPDAPVSMPVKWREVTSKLNNARFTIRNAVKRLRSLKVDPLAEVLTLKSNLGTALDLLKEHLQ